ncbi:aminotransferase class III-fold pyridoxal phosphate-dependent enzyme [Polaribacter litorisediminis]|uniref:aminotransferase class III-fold pyridoxal phosphate-dependent enzyme n=1 Tax=Polaribacter litorisediminis TaxID=1908341 RepID=UPI001CBB5465|nr:aminotransferase class III-fold pyridoxal phosphate-dependent enzyme [Polaribacter litorisediminis]UAM97072.1 aminotransferase class III-fold pyridoxal phosphate-dependent enzyme [Polaribacter litorisediminis]
MKTDQRKPTKKEAEEILFRVYNIRGTASALPGEIDANFSIKIEGKNEYILKISPKNTAKSELDFQQKILQHLNEKDISLKSPKVILDTNKNSISEISIDSNTTLKVRLLTWIDARVWSSVNPQLTDLRFSLGEKAGEITNNLQDFHHPKAKRTFAWDIAQGVWIKEYLHLFKNEEKATISYFLNKFEAFQKEYQNLRKSVVHNDANDNNVLVSGDLIHPKVTAIIDFGDAIKTQIINDVAITCCYAMMHHTDPLEASLPIIKGYHSKFPLAEKELEFLYVLIAMRLVISVTKSAINKIEHPENEYLLISEKTAWDLLNNWQNVSEDFAHYSFRNACGFLAHPNQQEFENWAKGASFSLSELFPTINRNEIHHLDLSVSSTFPGHQKEFNNLDVFQFKIEQLQKEVPNKILAGGYLEPRNLYTSTEYDTVGNYGKQSRTIHLGIDFWLPENTPVHALFDGEVVIVENDQGDKEYGGLIVLKHQQKDFCFYTLYGHNTAASVLSYKLGDTIKKGEQIAVLANYPENGNWAPHLHFQVMLSLLDYKTDFPGVAYFNQIDVWKSLCPNPNLLFKLDGFKENLIDDVDEILTQRKQHLGKGMSLQYQKPLHIVKGANQYLIDAFGRKYLDTVNNVAHVGHENFKAVKAGQNQMALLNTNTRYLHENITILAEELLATLPKEISVLHFVNSGSEANELAIRMVKTCTNSDEIIASEHGYHGNTNETINISSYKFDGKGGKGKPKNTHIFPIPDVFKGKYRGENTADNYAEEIQVLIDEIHQQHKKVGGFIIEPIISCGGQVELPEGFLKQAYQIVKKAGGLCISDEVQTGIGRMGKTFWGFQLHDVIPDIVTIGKPLGNGHPIAAVACTEEVAQKFANGMEFFNTFGGNPVSCAIATEVLREVKREKLQENALEVGGFLKSKFIKLSHKFPIIGDVRGQGLFLGIELVDKHLNPLAEKTDYVINRMKEFGILMSSDGPDHNVIKIKPPITFTKENAQEVIFYLQKILGEDFMKQN